MAKYRIGKDLKIKIDLKTNGASTPIEGRHIEVILSKPLGGSARLGWTADPGSNILTCYYPGNDQDPCGTYHVTVWENRDEQGMTALDFDRAFELVPSTSLEVPPANGLNIAEVIKLQGDMAVGIQGASAYEIAVKLGFAGTEQEWIQSLKQPAIDAAERADLQRNVMLKLEGNIRAAEQERTTTENARSLAEADRNDEELLRINAENLRIVAENERVKAESSRSMAEQERASNEQARENAESNRVNAEQLRVTAENSRVTAEQERATAEQQRVVAENGRVAAEQARVTEFNAIKEDAARVNNETLQVKSDTLQVKADTLTAKNATIKATTDANAATDKANASSAKADASAVGADNAAKLATDAAANVGSIDYVVCATPATTAIKEVTVAGFAIGTRCRFLVKMNNIADAADVKLSVITGSVKAEAKPLLYNGAPASINNTWRAGDVLDVYYDGASFQATHYLGGYGVNEINVSEMCPKGGIGGTNKFTLAEAIQKIPECHRRIGFKCSFINDKNKLQTFVYQGNTWNNNASWTICEVDSLKALFISAGNGQIKYNAQTGFYEMHGLTDITEQQMLEIYNNRKESWGSLDGNGNTLYEYWVNYKGRIPLISRPTRSDGGWANLTRFCAGSSIQQFPYRVIANNIHCAFQQCYNLKKIARIELVYNNYTTDYWNSFFECYELRSIELAYIKKNTFFRESPLINYESVRYLIENAKNTQVITVAVHPTTYGYLMGTTPPTEQVGGTTEQWQEIVTLATSKQITFTT